MSFSFLNPAVLWAIPLSLVPLLLHLLFRKPPKSVLFSDLRFLKMIYEQYRPRKKLKEWLILLFRILTLFCLFTFFSRPVLHWGGKIGAEDSTALVVLLDASYSMRYQESGLSNWSRASRLAETALKSLRETDRSALVIFSDRIEYFSGALTNLHQETAGKIAAFKPTYRNTNILPALQMAYQLLQYSGASNKAVLIVSDMARHGWSGEASEKEDKSKSWIPLIKQFDPTVKIIYTYLPEQRRNVSVEDVQLSPDLYAGQVKVRMDLKNWGGETERSVPAFLHFYGQGENQRQSETLVTLDPLQKETVNLTAPLQERSGYEGEAGIEPDFLPVDDTFFIAQPSLKRIKVLCVEEPSGIAALSGESYYLRQALSAPPSPFEVKTVTMNELKKMTLTSYQVIVLVNIGEYDDDTLSMLSQFRKNGGALFFTLGPRSKPGGGEFNELIPCGLQETRDVSTLSLAPAANIDNEEWAHFQNEYEWEKIQVDKIVQPEIKPGADAWILFSDRTPFLIFSDDGKTAVWTTTIDREWNNLPSKPIFVPLTRFVLKTLGATASQDQAVQLTVGESLRFKLPSSIKKSSLSLLSPKLEKLEIHVGENEALSSPLEEPGIYSLVEGGEKNIVLNFAVNADRKKEESNGASIRPDDLNQLLPGIAWKSIDPGEHFGTELTAALRGKELTRYFIVFAGLFLLGEMVLVSRK